jgi:hypothetical protein
MNTKLLGFLFVALAAVAAAGTGAYLAVRTNRAPAVATAELDGAAPAAAPEAAGVAETEGVVTPEPTAATNPAGASFQPAASPAPAPAPSPSRSAAHPQSRIARDTSPRPAPATRERRSSTEPRSTPAPAEGSPETPRESTPTTVLPPMFETPPAPAPAPPPVPEFEDVVVPADAVIGLQIENNLTSETARVEDRVDARVTRDVRAGGLVAIPAGSKVQGSVTLVERGGKVKERARLGVRFHTLVLADGTRLPIQTETILREGESPAGESAAKIGGAAVGGAIIGAILGGGKGAAIGGSVGAAGGTTAVMAGSRNPATLSAGSTVTARLSAPATVTVEK